MAICYYSNIPQWKAYLTLSPFLFSIPPPISLDTSPYPEHSLWQMFFASYFIYTSYFLYEQSDGSVLVISVKAGSCDSPPSYLFFSFSIHDSQFCSISYFQWHLLFITVLLTISTRSIKFLPEVLCRHTDAFPGKASEVPRNNCQPFSLRLFWT